MHPEVRKASKGIRHPDSPADARTILRDRADVPREASLRMERRRFLSLAGAGASMALSLSLASRVRAQSADGDGPAEDVPSPPRFLLEWGRPGSGEGEFSACVGIAIGPGEVIHTAEFRNERVQRFTTEGKFLGMFPVQPHAGGLAVDSDGVVHVAHWNSDKIASYAPDGTLLREWGGKGTGDGQFRLPGSIALGPDDLLYVPDQGNSRVQKFTREGKFVGKWGSLGGEPGQFGGTQPEGGRFAGPQFVAFDAEGHVYTTDAALDRVSKFTPDGTLLDHWGSESADPGGFGPPPLYKGNPTMGGPISLCVDRRNRVWVGSTNHRVQRFTNDGRFLHGLGLEGEGTEPGRFRTPHGLLLDAEGALYVCDTMNGRIQKFAAG